MKIESGTRAEPFGDACGPSVAMPRAVPGALQGLSNNPATDTVSGDGASSEGFHLDWLTLVLEWKMLGKDGNALSHERVRAAIADLICGEPDVGILQRIETSSGLELYRLNGGGVSVVSSGGPGGLERVTVNVTGRAWEWVDQAALCEFWCWCVGSGVAVHASRIDLAWDDPGFEFEAVRAAWACGDVRCPAGSEIIERHVRDADTGEIETQSTFYAGSRKSRRRLRIYNMRGPVRVELQLRGERAEHARRLVLCNDDGIGRTLDIAEGMARGMLIDFCEFVDASGHGNLSRCDRLTWWAAFIEGVTRVRCVIPRVLKTVEGMKDWVEHVAASTLATVYDCLDEIGKGGERWVKQLVALGREQRKPRQNRVLQALCIRVRSMKSIGSASGMALANIG